jgi:hypothetical protein
MVLQFSSDIMHCSEMHNWSFFICAHFRGISSALESPDIRFESEYSDIILCWFSSSFQPTAMLLQFRLQMFPAKLFAVRYSLALLIL